MKRRISSVVLALCAFGTFSFGQKNLSNGDFETWETRQVKSVKNWLAAGDVTSTTDAYEGSSAIKLVNSQASSMRGFVTTGPFVNNKLYGIPYNEQPLSVRFRCKYDLAPGDQAQVAVLFTLKGNTIAFSSTLIEGSSKDTFGYFSVPITWQVSTNPDTVAIALSSLNLESNEFNGDGYIIFDDFHFATISTRNKEVPNGDFEDWDVTDEPYLKDWYTTDDYMREIAVTNLPEKFVTQTATGRTGSKAVQLKSQMVNGDIVPGMLLAGQEFKGFEKPAVAIDKAWKYFEGYYQYNPVNGDTAFMGVIMYKSGVPLASAEHIITKASSTYNYFALELNYSVQMAPDSALVFIACNNPDGGQGAGTTLILDDLKFSDQNASVFDYTESRLKVYPNPCSDFIRIDGPNQIIGSTWTITDAVGHIVLQGEVDKNNEIDVSDLRQGTYVLSLNGKHINLSKLLLKE